MQIAFSTEEIRDLCTLDTNAIQHLGQKAADALKNRLADIEAAEFIHELVAGKPRRTVIEGRDHYQVELDDDYVLTLMCNQPNPRLDNEGRIEWNRVRRIKVVSIGKQ